MYFRVYAALLLQRRKVALGPTERYMLPLSNSIQQLHLLLRFYSCFDGTTQLKTILITNENQMNILQVTVDNYQTSMFSVTHPCRFYPCTGITEIYPFKWASRGFKALQYISISSIIIRQFYLSLFLWHHFYNLFVSGNQFSS